VLYQLKYMKYNPILRSKKAAGFTLIEISLVIALLLGLIAVVFIGLGSYREGSNKAQCKMQLAAVQKAVRSYANMNNIVIDAAGTIPDTHLEDGTIMAVKPVCPSGGTYTYKALAPAVGIPYADCSYDGGAVAANTHVLTGTTGIADW
jgi:type II secretory pathway pseudopilin PulG